MEKMQVYQINNSRVTVNLVIQTLVVVLIIGSEIWFVSNPLSKCIREIRDSSSFTVAMPNIGILVLFLLLMIVGNYVLYVNVRRVFQTINLLSCRISLSEQSILVQGLLWKYVIPFSEVQHVLQNSHAITLIWEENNKLHIFHMAENLFSGDTFCAMKAFFSRIDSYTDDPEIIEKILSATNKKIPCWM